MTLAGLALAARLSRRSEAELLAQAVDGLLPLYRDANGGFYFAREDLATVPPRTTCVVKGCGRRLHAHGLCSTHYERLRRGADVGARIQVEKAQRGADRKQRTGQRMRLLPHHDAPESLEVARQGDTVALSAWDRENAAAEQLGTPEMWRQVADEALERAWRDLMSGDYAGRLAALQARAPQPKAIQSPLVATVRPESHPERERRTA